MIDLHLVVQGQGVIPQTPVVTDTLVPVDDQRVDTQRAEACRDRKSGLPPPTTSTVGSRSSYDSRARRLSSQFGPRKSPRIRLAGRTVLAHCLRMIPQLIKCRKQRPAAPLSIIG